METPSQHGRAPIGPLVPRVVALAGPTTSGLIMDLASTHRMSVRLAQTPDEVVALIDASGADIAIIFIEQLPGWPVTEAEKLAVRLGGRIPLVIMAEALDDAEVLEQRIAGPMVHIMTRGSFTRDLLASAVKASLARVKDRT